MQFQQLQTKKSFEKVYKLNADGNFELIKSQQKHRFILLLSLQIQNSSGTYNETYYYDGRDLVAKKDIDGAMFYYHPDHLGSTTLITNSTGGIVENTFYLPFGEVISGGENKRKLYESKELDNTELYYFGSRYYNPYMTMFIQPDSIIPNAYDPQQLNAYAFERGNPYTYVDKDGHVAGVLAAFSIIATFVVVDYVVDIISGEKNIPKTFMEAYESFTSSAGETIGRITTTEEGMGEFLLAGAATGVLNEIFSGGVKLLLVQTIFLK